MRSGHAKHLNELCALYCQARHQNGIAGLTN